MKNPGRFIRLAALAGAFALSVSVTAEARPIPTSCGAINLLSALAKESPDAGARMKAAAKTVVNGDGMLWRIDKPGLRPSHLFGTMHSTDPRLERQVQRVLPLVRNASAVAVEISELVTPGLKDAAALQIAHAGLATRGNALEALHPIQDRGMVELALLERGIPAQRAERLETWFLIVVLSSPPCERQRRALGLVSVDEKIGVAGAKAGRKPIGLEKIEDQIAVLRRIGGWNPPAVLIETARNATMLANMRETQVQTYAADRLGELVALTRIGEVISTGTLSRETSSFTRSLLDDRNLVMRDNAMPLLEKGGAVIAVGALHLPGDRGLVSLFREKGFRVTPVK
ncbi:MAG: TraB/GumN family protein [Beijerinckiaceae bacterium]